jgi:hypothetical protein
MSKLKAKTQLINQTFTCANCGASVAPAGSNGTANRNHCPFCLCSKHVDVQSGDRRSACGGVMEPVAVWVKQNKEWAIVHRCRKCGFIRANRIAGDDNELQLFLLAARPLTQLPFPADMLKNIG